MPPADPDTPEGQAIDWIGWRGRVALGLGVFFVLIHIYAGVFGSPDSLFFRALHVNAALATVFLIRPLGGADASLWQRALDLVLLAATLAVQAYFVVELETWNLRTIFFRPIDYVVSLAFVGLVLEATRRTVGPILVGICVFFMLHALYADHFPGFFYGPPSSLQNLLQAVFLDSNGIFGVAVAVMANFVVLFILFGTLLNASGGGAFFTRLSFAVFGHRVGGPAKAAVASSAMMGSLSGSAIGNVLTTGVFTIPLMIRLGYRRAFAGGVEAAASNGGIIMPPVMGAVAFIMAEFLDRPYLEIVLAAIVPAALYFLVIFVSVDTEARREGLPVVPAEKLPRAWGILRREGYLLLPILLIIAALAMGYSIVFVAIIVCAGTFVLALLRPGRRLRPLELAAVVDETARATVTLSVTAAAAGIILGAIFAVGLSFQVAQAATAASQGYLWLLLLLTALMAVIMGMGMTAPAIYLTLVATVIPILIQAGIPAIAAHFFAFYYGIISNITPPVALTAYAAAPIARASPLAVGVQASRLGVGCFLLPLLFIYEPALLLEGSWGEIVQVTATSALGLSAFAVAATGYAFAPLPPWSRVGAVGVFALAIVPGAWSDVAAFALAALVFVPNMLERRREAHASRTGPATTETDAATEAESEALLARIAADETTERPPVGRADLWIGWAAVVAVALAIAWAGEMLLHARAPLAWAALHVGLAFAVTAVILVLHTRSRQAERGHADGVAVPIRSGTTR